MLAFEREKIFAAAVAAANPQCYAIHTRTQTSQTHKLNSGRHIEIYTQRMCTQTTLDRAH